MSAAVADTELDEAPLPPVHTGRDAVLVVVGYLIASLTLLGPLGIFFPSMLIELGVIDEILLAGLCWAVVRLRWGAQAVTAMVRRPARPVAAIGIAATVGIVVSLVERGSLWLWELIASPLPGVQAWIGEELSAGGLVTVLSVVMALGLAPLSEELFFRAVLYGGLRASWGFWPAALVSSGVFAVVHIDATLDSSVLLMGLIFPWGLLAAAVYQRLGLWAAVALHAANNTVALVGWSLAW